MAEPAAGRQRLQPFAKNVATGVHLAILTDAIEALDAAEKAGTPFEEAQAAIVAKVQGGWTAPGAPRLALTTMNAAAQAVNLGRAEVFASPEAVAKRPFRYFSAVGDDRTSEVCEECDGVMLPAGHPWWATHIPSLHLRCRSAVVAATATQAAAHGTTKNPPKVDVDEGFGTMADLCSWEPLPGAYPAELHEAFFPMSDHAPHVHRLDLGVSDVHVPTTVRPRRLGDSYEGIDFAPPKGAREEADRGLAWRREFGRGGTSIGIARARDLSRGANLSPSTVRRMASYFARHEVDKQGKGWSPGEDGFPSNGRIAWALWGGDAGRAWASKVVKQMNARTASEGTARAMAINTFPRLAKKRKPLAKVLPKGKPMLRAPLEGKPAVGLVRRKGLHFRIGLASDGHHTIEVMHAKGAATTDDAPVLMRGIGCPLDLSAAVVAWVALADCEASLASLRETNGATISPEYAAQSERLAALRLDADKPVWIQIAKVGSWKGHPAGPFEMTPQTFAEIERNFRETVNQRIPIDFEHASEAPGDSGSIPADGAPAQGWIIDLDNRGNAGLFGLVEWLEPARSYIRAGKYRYFSPAVRFGSRDRVSGKPIGARMTSGALTNIPFLDGLVPVAAADRATGATTMSLDRHLVSHDFMARMRAALKCGDTDTLEKMSAKCADLRDLCATMDDAMMSQGVDLKSYMTDLAGLMNMPAHTTLGDLLDAVEEMLEAAIARHVAAYHPDGSSDDEAPPSHPTGATMSDQKTTQDVAVQLGETKALAATLAAEKTALMSERDALATEKASLSLRLKEAESATAEVTAKLTATEATLALKNAEIDKRNEDDLDGSVRVAFETYKDAKKLTDDDKAAMRITLKSDPALFGRLYPVVAPGERGLLANLTGGRMPTGKTAAMSDKPRPVTSTSVGEPSTMAPADMVALSDKYVREGMSREKAIQKAYIEARKSTAS